MSEITIIRATDPAELFRLAGTVGWNQTPQDCHEMLLSPGASGVFAVCEGEVVGSAAAMVYGGNRIGYINMVIVLEPYRGRGIATRMLGSLMEILNGCRTLRLYATEAGSHVYRKIGFRTYATLHKISADDYLCRMPEGVRSLTPEDLPEITRLDAAAFGIERAAILRYFYERHPELCFKIMRGNVITGFTIGRIGPVSRQASALTAATEEDALLLLDAVACRGTPSKRMLAVAFDSQKSLISRMQEKGFQLSTNMVAMDYGEPGPMPAKNYFGVLGGDFG